MNKYVDSLVPIGLPTPCFSICSKPHIVIEKSTAPTHLGESSTTSLFMEIIIYNYVFSEDPKSKFHTIPPLVVKTTCASHAFLLLSKLIYPTSNFDMGFYKPYIFLSIFKIIFCLSSSDLMICLQVQLSL